MLISSDRWKIMYSFRHNNKGFVAIVVAFLIPLVLIGVKWSLSLITKNSFEQTLLQSSNLYKKCAKEAALAAAKKYNPGESFSLQQYVVQKAADDVYNSFPCYHDSAVGEALYGIDRPSELLVKSPKGYAMPITVKNIKRKTSAPSARQIEYKTESRTIYKYYSSQTRPNAHLIYNVWDDFAYPNQISDILKYQYENEDIFTLNQTVISGSSRYWYSITPHSYYGSKDSSYTTNTRYIRKNSDNAKLSISVENDKIKVITDQRDTGYAVPAECNVDIVLSIPTNSAACNVNNYDQNTPTTGKPYTCPTSFNSSYGSNSLSVPMCQIARAYRSFLKDNFYYTRGVYVSLIPYSGKMALHQYGSFSRGTGSNYDSENWKVDFPAFSINYFNEPYMFGNFLYSSTGTKKTMLSTTKRSYEYGHDCGIMAKIGYQKQLSDYGNNYLNVFDLLSSEKVSTSGITNRYIFWNSNPCTVENANLLSMKCGKDNPTYYAQPYITITSEPDLRGIYEMLGAMYPISYDEHNESNFTFIPITWANNCFQSWTYNPSRSATSDQLSLPSKTTSGRKKVLILVVNKPDHFEPNELTYIGFNNDWSEVPAMESDKIDFSIDYSDTSKKYPDGSSYDSTIQGQKKILKYTQTTKKGTGRLSFPQKGTVLIKVKASSPPSIPTLSEWKLVSKTLGQFSGDGLAYGNGVFVAMRDVAYGKTSYSVDGGKTWTRNEDFSTLDFTSSDERWFGVTYGNGQFVSVHNDGYFACSSDGKNWSLFEDKLSASTTRYISHYNGKFMTTSMTTAYTSDDLKQWKSMYTKNSGIGLYLVYGNDIYVHLNIAGWISVSEDQGKTWSSYEKNPLGSGTMDCLHFIEGNFITLSNKACYVSEDGKIWKTTPIGNLFDILSSYSGFLCYAQGHLYALDRSGTLAVCEKPFLKTSQSGTITINGNTYSVKKPKTFLIKKSEISNTQDSDGNYYIDINTENVELVSAEIMNFEVEKVDPVTVSYKNADYRTVSITKLSSSSSSTESVTETIDFANGYTSCNVGWFECSSANNIGDAKMNSGYGYEIYSESGTCPVRFETDYPCTISLTVEPVKAVTTVWELTNPSNPLNAIDTGEWIDVCYGNGRLLAINENGAVAVSTDKGKTWTKAGAIPSSLGCEKVCYYKGTDNVNRFVTVGWGGTVAVSTDNGANWTKAGSISIGGCWDGGICYCDDRLVAVSRDDYVAASTDNGVTWFQTNSSTTTPLQQFDGNWFWNNCCYYTGSDGVKRLIEVNTFPNIVISTDKGSTWTKAGSSCYTDDICYNEKTGELVIINHDDICRSTNNGTTWKWDSDTVTKALSLSGSNSSWLDWSCLCACDDGTLVAIHEDGIVARYELSNIPSSTIDVNGSQEITGSTTISISSSKFSSCGNAYCCTFNANNIRFKKATLTYSKPKGLKTYRISAPKSGTAVLYVKKKPVGLANWTSRGNPLSAWGSSWSSHGNSLVYGRGKFVVANSSGVVAQSSDGINWTKNSNSCSTCRGIAYGGGYFLTCKGFYYSSDGVSWTSGNSAGGTQDDDITFGNGMFMCIADGPGFYFKSKANTGSWINPSTNFSSAGLYADYSSYAFGNGRFASVHRNSSYQYIGYSYNGIDWTKAGTLSFSSSSTNEGGAITFGNGKFCFVSYAGEFFTSTNGSSWTKVGTKPLYEATSQQKWSGIAYGKGRWVAVSYDGYVATCEDPIGTVKYNVGSTTITSTTGQVVTLSLSSYNSSYGYYKDVEMNNVEVISNAIIYTESATVDDLIAFCDNTTSKNGTYHSLTYSGSGSTTNGLFTCSSGSGTITLSSKGKLKLKVMPSLSASSGSFRFTTGSDTSTKTISGISEYTIEVENQAVNGNNREVRFSMTNIVLVRAEFIAEDIIVRLKKFRTPVRSSYVDFTRTSGGKPVVYSSNYVVYGSNSSGSLPSSTSYDSTWEYWYTTGTENRFYDYKSRYKNVFWFISNDDSTSAAIKKLYYSSSATSSSANQGDIYLPGMVRLTYDADAVHDYFKFDANGFQSTLISAGFTQPINNALYFGYGNNTLFKYKWQGQGSSSSNSVYQLDSDTALKQVTKDACAKLRTDYGSNLRVYVIKYRAQTQHTYKYRSGSSIYTGTENNDYSYLNNCAYNGSSTTTASPYMKSVSNEEELKTHLKTIAADIKKWAGYKEAKIVD